MPRMTRTQGDQAREARQALSLVRPPFFIPLKMLELISWATPPPRLPQPAEVALAMPTQLKSNMVCISALIWSGTRSSDTQHGTPWIMSVTDLNPRRSKRQAGGARTAQRATGRWGERQVGGRPLIRFAPWSTADTAQTRRQQIRRRSEVRRLAGNLELLQGGSQGSKTR
jgi:hypothetical protein